MSIVVLSDGSDGSDKSDNLRTGAIWVYGLSPIAPAPG